MISLKEALKSQVGRKVITALTGLAWVGFVITHLLGNLALFDRTGVSFNQYSARLHTLGPLLLLAEVGLVAFFMTHAVNGILLKLKNRSARPIGYQVVKSKVKESKSGLSSNYMAVSGIVLLVFVFLHVKQFRFGPSLEDGYSMDINGTQVWDIHRVVTEAFTNPVTVAVYVLAMIFLGLHLKHGIWSAFQSMGWLNKRTSPVIYSVGGALAVLLAIGFLILPIYVYLVNLGVL